MEEWFLNSELEKTFTTDSTKSEKLAKLALAMNRPSEAVDFLENKEWVAEVHALEGRTQEALRNAEKCNRLCKERMLARPPSKKETDVKDMLSLLSLRVGTEKKAKGKFFKDK